MPKQVPQSDPDRINYVNRCSVQLPGERFERIMYGLTASDYAAMRVLGGNTLVAMGEIKDLGSNFSSRAYPARRRSTSSGSSSNVSDILDLTGELSLLKDKLDDRKDAPKGRSVLSRLW